MPVILKMFMPFFLILSFYKRNHVLAKIQGLFIGIQDNFHFAKIKQDLVTETFSHLSSYFYLPITDLHQRVNLLRIQKRFISLHINDIIKLFSIQLIGLKTTICPAWMLRLG